jgi:hypothetical protein
MGWRTEMKAVFTPYYCGKPGQQTDFEEGNGWCLEMVRANSTREFLFAFHKSNETKVQVVREIMWASTVLIPLKNDEVLQHVRFPVSISHEVPPVNDLLQKIDL